MNYDEYLPIGPSIRATTVILFCLSTTTPKNGYVFSLRALETEINNNKY